MPIEVEARFRAPGPGPLSTLAATPVLGHARLGPAASVDEEDRYLDTDDGRLGAARWACRLRTRDGAVKVSLKGPPLTDLADGLHRRPEHEGPADPGAEPSAWPPSDARERLLRLSAGRQLVERFRLHQRRTERAVLVEPERRLGTLSLDAVRIQAGGRDLGSLWIVELEMTAGDGSDDAELVLLAGALGATPGLEPEPRTKLERALERMSEAR